MRLTHTATQETISIEDGFLWSDEFDWKPIEQKQERAIDGTLIVQEGKKKSGRLMTLTPPDEHQGWIKRHVLSKLMDWSALQDSFVLQFEYPHDTRRFNVIFNHQDGAIEAKPIKGFPAVNDDEFYSVTLRFLIVEDE